MSIPRAKRGKYHFSIHRDFSYNNKDVVPGPQQYDSTNFYKTKGSGSKIGKQKRLNETFEDLPGVGTYNLPQLIFRESPSYRLSGKWHDKYQQKPDKSPSPLSYRPIYESYSVFTKSPKYSISKSSWRQKSETSLSPGPCHYSPKESTSPKGNKGSRFPGSSRKPLETNADIPGPDKYITESHPQNGRKSPKISFTKAIRSFSSTNQVSISPGPGRYQTQGSNKKFKGGVIGNSNPEAFTYNKKVPGPGTYDAKFFYESSQAPIFPTSVRERPSREISPGPQKYEIQDQHKEPSYSFGQQKKQLWKFTDGPGPGQYEQPEVQKHKQKIFLIGKPKDYMMISQDQMRTPSPQNYSPTSGKKILQIVFPKAQRTPMYLNENINYPGPGEYYRQQKRIYKFAHSYSKRRNMSYSDTPGPGQYEQTQVNSVDPMIKMTVLKKLFN